ncbi:MAG TPA: hypothetical protein VGL99_33455 [Chloroflexota bacterium]
MLIVVQILVYQETAVPGFAPRPASGMQDLSSEADLQARFAQDIGHTRLLLLISPTRPECRRGASWVQNEILSKHPQADLDVYVVWFNMFPGDTRWRWDGDEMTDPRVVHYSDERESVGTWFSANLTERGSPTWDFYALYPPDAHDSSALTGFGGGAQGGGTIIGHHAQLAAAIAPLLQPKS